MRGDTEIYAKLDKELCERLMTIHNTMLEAMSQGNDHSVRVNPQMASDILEAIVALSYRCITDAKENALK